MSDWYTFDGDYGRWSAATGNVGVFRFISYVESIHDGTLPAERELCAALVAVRPNRRPVDASPELLDWLRGCALSSRSRPSDLVIAAGCGWPHDNSYADEPPGLWPGAVLEFVANVRASLAATAGLLRMSVPSLVIGDDDLIELPSIIATAMLRGCGCGHHQRSCKGRCNTTCCSPPHRLAAWNPAECTLRAYIDQAVRGTASRTILGGAFAESILYRLLEAEGRVLRRRVEFRRCSACSSLFEGHVCGSQACGTPAGPSTPRVARANWLVVPALQGGDYAEVVRWECGECGNLVIKHPTVTSCPQCSRSVAGVKNSSITVWVKLAAGRTHLEDVAS